jgi:hypothetical protein
LILLRDLSLLSSETAALLSCPSFVLTERLHVLIFERVFQVGVSVALFNNFSIGKDLLSTFKDEDIGKDPTILIRLLPVIFKPDPLSLTHSPGESGSLLT